MVVSIKPIELNTNLLKGFDMIIQNSFMMRIIEFLFEEQTHSINICPSSNRYSSPFFFIQFELNISLAFLLLLYMLRFSSFYWCYSRKCRQLFLRLLSKREQRSENNQIDSIWWSFLSLMKKWRIERNRLFFQSRKRRSIKNEIDHFYHK